MTSIIVFVVSFYAAIGLTTSVMKKIVKGENTPMFSFEKDQINVLKYSLLVALCLIGLVLVTVLIAFITKSIGLGFIGTILMIVVIPVSMVKFMLVIPSCVDDSVVGIKQSFIKTTGYELSLIGILLLLMVSVFVVAFIGLISLAFISPILVLVFGIVVNIVSQILGFVVAAKIYLHFKNNNLLD
ncbi:MAG: hypothetical protein BWY78_01460 [Alphaproteobacteria bacterium ADurb.Bin438]|nr:MAG: hypothetical protein BWY78_01460 [Alphaproteobacteria bacterium ADurb.Bin438]